jgi:hypothetical protein
MQGFADVTYYQDRANDRGVYAVTCMPTGSVYVGSSGAVVQRWRQHKATLRRGKNGNPVLQAEWDRYGEDAFEFKLLEYVKDPADLIASEQRWIDQLGTANRLSARVGRPGRVFLQKPETQEARDRRKLDESVLEEWAVIEVTEEFRAARRFSPGKYAPQEEHRTFRRAFEAAVESKKAEILARGAFKP